MLNVLNLVIDNRPGPKLVCLYRYRLRFLGFRQSRLFLSFWDVRLTSVIAFYRIVPYLQRCYPWVITSNTVQAYWKCYINIVTRTGSQFYWYTALSLASPRPQESQSNASLPYYNILMYVCMYICMHEYTYASKYVCIYVLMYLVCTYVCAHGLCVYMYKLMYIRICM